MLIVPIIILTDSYHDGTQRFDMFVKIFNKSYHQNVVEYDRRLRIFQVHNLIIHNNSVKNVLRHIVSFLCVLKQSLGKIRKLNHAPLECNLSAVYGVTSFADLPPIEFKQRHLKLSSKDQIRNNRISGATKSSSWKRFSFVNGTQLKSGSMTLPLKVDW